MAPLAKTQGTTSGQLFVTNKTAFVHFWPPRLPKAVFGTPILVWFSCLVTLPERLVIDIENMGIRRFHLTRASKLGLNSWKMA